MPIFSDALAFRIIDSVAIVFAQAYHLARARVASCASPVLRLMAQRDPVSWEIELLRRELDILRGQRENLPPHRRPGYWPDPRLAILQIMRMRNWSGVQVAKRISDNCCCVASPQPRLVALRLAQKPPRRR